MLGQLMVDKSFVTPQYLYIHPNDYRLGMEVLRGAGWHYKNTARWRYLVKRGARR
jgi:hypothetical protein